MTFNDREAKALHLQTEREFEKDGKKYDILSRHYEGSRMVVYCVNDRAEELLYAKASGDAGRSNELQLLKTLSLFLYDFPQPQIVVSYSYESQVLHNTPYVKNYPEPSFDILSPPPQV